MRFLFDLKGWLRVRFYVSINSNHASVSNIVFQISYLGGLALDLSNIGVFPQYIVSGLLNFMCQVYSIFNYLPRIMFKHTGTGLEISLSLLIMIYCTWYWKKKATLIHKIEIISWLICNKIGETRQWTYKSKKKW